MNEFDEIVSFVIDELEGGDKLVYDSGGVTRFGIASKSHPGVDVPNLTREDAIEIYRRQYWIACGCDALAWPMNFYIFDCAVNQGPGFARQVKAAYLVPEDILLLRVSRYASTAAHPDMEQYLRGWLDRVIKCWHLGQQS